MGLRYYAKPWYWLPGLLDQSPSCFLDPWTSRTYDPRFCIFCMPVPGSDVQYVRYLLSSPHSRQSSPSLNVCAVSVVWPVHSPTATLSSCLLIAWNSFVQLGRGSPIRVLEWRKPLEVFHLFRCFCLKRLLMTSLPTTKRIPRSKMIKIFVWKWEIQGTAVSKGLWGKGT